MIKFKVTFKYKDSASNTTISIFADTSKKAEQYVKKTYGKRNVTIIYTTRAR